MSEPDLNQMVIHPQGIRGVFNPAEINEILKFTETLAA